MLGGTYERSFRVNVETLSLSASHINGQLASDRKRVAQLTLACPEFAVKLSDATRLHASAENSVQVL